MDTSTLSRVEAVDRLGAHLLGAPDAPDDVRCAVAAVCALALPAPPVPVAYDGPWQGLYRAWLRHVGGLDAAHSARGDALHCARAWAAEIGEVVL